MKYFLIVIEINMKYSFFDFMTLKKEWISERKLQEPQADAQRREAFQVQPL
jgi:hypothetical protein